MEDGSKSSWCPSATSYDDIGRMFLENFSFFLHLDTSHISFRILEDVDSFT